MYTDMTMPLHDLKVQGDMLYLLNDEGFFICEITDSYEIQTLCNLESETVYHKLSVFDDRALLFKGTVDGEDVMQARIVDITDINNVTYTHSWNAMYNVPYIHNNGNSFYFVTPSYTPGSGYYLSYKKLTMSGEYEDIISVYEGIGMINTYEGFCAVPGAIYVAGYHIFGKVAFNQGSPLDFDLVTPPRFTDVSSTELTFSWEPSHGWLEEDSVSYELQIAEGLNFTTPRTVSTGSDTSITVYGLRSDSAFYWRVVSRDQDGDWNESRQIRRFRCTYSEAICDHALLAPDDGDTIRTASDEPLQLVWEQCRTFPLDPVDYTLTTRLFNDSFDTTMTWWALPDTAIAICFADSLGQVSPLDPLTVKWSVMARIPQFVAHYDTSRSFTLIFDTDVEEATEASLPATFQLAEIYPNPFNSEVSIEVHLPDPSPVVLRVFNLLGQEVGRQRYSSLTAGVHRVAWAADPVLPSGVYFLRAETADGRQTATRRVLLLK